MNFTDLTLRTRNDEFHRHIDTLCADEIEALEQHVNHLKTKMDGQSDAIHRIIQRERANQRLACPKCGSTHFVKNGKTVAGRQKNICRDCKKSFSDTTNSIVHSTKKTYLVWNKFIECMDHGLSLFKTAKICGISKTTAFYWRHKVMDSMMDCQSDEVLAGEIQIDETYFVLNLKGFKSRGGKTMPRKAKKRGTPAIKRGVSNETVCVLVALDENDQLITQIIGQGNPTIDAIDGGLKGRMRFGSDLITDSKAAYQEVSLRHQCRLHQIPAGVHASSTFNLGSLNQIHSEMKVWFMRFRGVSTKHLAKYLHWFRFRKYQNYHFEIEDQKRMMFLFSIADQNTYPNRVIHRESYPVDIHLPYVS